VLRQTIVHELLVGQRSYQQGPSVEEENALFVDDEQAAGETPRVVVRLPGYMVVEHQLSSEEE
jgi:hypothetical protein